MRRIRDVAHRYGMPKDGAAAVGPREAALAHAVADREALRLAVGMWPLDVDHELRRFGLKTPADLLTRAPLTPQDKAFLDSIYRIEMAAARRAHDMVIAYVHDFATIHAPRAVLSQTPIKVAVQNALNWALGNIRLWQLTGRYVLVRLAEHELPSADPGLLMQVVPPPGGDDVEPYTKTLANFLWTACLDDLATRGERGLFAYFSPPLRPVVPPQGTPSFRDIRATLGERAGADLAADLLAGILGWGPPSFTDGAAFPEVDRVPNTGVRGRVPSAKEAAVAFDSLDARAQQLSAHRTAVLQRRQAVRETMLGRFVYEHATASGMLEALRAAILSDVSLRDDRAAAEAWGAETADRSGGAAGGWIFVTRLPEEGAIPRPEIPELVEYPDLIFHVLCRDLLIGRVMAFNDPVPDDDEETGDEPASEDLRGLLDDDEAAADTALLDDDVDGEAPDDGEDDATDA